MSTSMIVTKDDEMNAAARVPRKSIRQKRENDKSVPYVVNLHEDPMLSGIVYTPLLKGEITIGKKSGDHVPDIIIGAIRIQKNHAKIKLNQKGMFELHVVAEGAAGTMINGEMMSIKKTKRVLNHNDRISFAGANIYVFRYPKLKRTLKDLIAASAEIQEQSGISKEEQENLAWQMVLENGIEGVKKDDPNSMRVDDYAPDEVADDEHSASWDQALDEVENGEKIRQEKIQKERQ